MEEREKRIPGQEREALLASLREGKELEKWQKYFCSMANVFVCCTDHQGVPITELEGQEPEVARIRELIDGEQFENMRLRVSESALEDQAVEATAYPNLRLAVISCKVSGKTVVNWLVCGVLSDSGETEEEYENPPLQGFSSQISEKQFLRAVDTLRDMALALLEYKRSMFRQKERYDRICRSEREMGEKLKCMEALLEITKLLEREESVESTVGRVLKKAGEFLKLSMIALYYCPQRGTSRSGDSRKKGIPVLIADWYEKDGSWKIEVPAEGVSLLWPEKTLILSKSSTMSVEEREEMNALSLQAVLVMPVSVTGMEEVRICFGQKDRERTWGLEEIRFLGEVVKVIQSLLGRKAKESRSAPKRKSNTGRTKK